MKKILFLLSFILYWTSSLAGVRYTTANLNLRQGPGTNYGIVTTIPQGTPVTIEEDCNCKWIAVEYCGRIGYVSSKYLSRYYQINNNTSRYNDVLNSSRYNHSKRSSSSRYYTNVDGNRVQSPTYYSSVPAGATAICRDGTYSFSKNRRGTCSHHGGVAKWL